MIIIQWLKWFFGISGIVCVEESGKLSWLQAIKNMFSGGAARKPDGPSHLDHVGYAKMGLNVKRHRCPGCGVYFWSWRKRKTCYRWKCFREKK